ncbi:MAG: crossover junction endodeoxyribonuclease RuvC [Bradymonadia bacterium]
MRTIIGIDPGSRLCGWAVIQQAGSVIKHVDNGVIVLDEKAPLHRRLASLHLAIQALIEKHAPTNAAIESVFQHRNPHSALVLGHARGVALTCFALANISVQTFAPTEIKKLVAGHGRASKEQIQIMVARHLGLSDIPQSDAADAAAVALCHGLEVRLGNGIVLKSMQKRKRSKKQSDALLMQLAKRGK